IRGYWNAAHEQLYVFRLHEHSERLLQSGHLLRMKIPYSATDIDNLTIELLRREGYRTNVYIRPLIYKADEIIGVRLHDLQDRLTIFAVPFGRYIEKEEGASVCVSSWRRNDDNALPPRAKVSGGYVNSAFIKSDAQLKGFDDAIVLNQDGHVSEGSAQNLFMIRNGKLITTPVTANILEGITRGTVLELAQAELGLETQVREIDRTELYLAEELFLCGTGVQIAAVTSVDHYRVGDGKIGPITQQLRDLYFRVVNGEVEKYRGWCTPVY
ncbi:MAG: branched-chain amino acid transaminase, partial [Anaerolineae bacterium]|nr:branched-chain amino acid transaminase [Anaerolineae bacterium]